MTDYDVVFIGSGHAAWHAAITLRQAGKSVAIVEEDTIAGTCTNYGCDPKILLDGPFELNHQLSQYQGVGVENHATINWQQLMAYKHQVIDPLPIQMATLFKKLGIEILNGHGRLVSPHEIDVDGQRVTAKDIVIGTGQRPRKLNIPGQDYLHDSRDFLSLEEMPKRITFIGAGIISLEFASMAIQLGAEVHVIEFTDHALGNFHKTYADKIVQVLTQLGVKFHFNKGVTAVDKTKDGYQVEAGDELKFLTDYVIDATGRTANVENLGLEEVGIEFNRNGIVVDDHLRTTQATIFASGDVIDKQIPRLTPTATFESNYIAGQLLGNDEAIVYPVIPSVIFTLPRLAQVGVTPEEAEESSQDYRVQVVPYGKQLLFQSKNEVTAELTVVLDKSGQLVGATIYGNDAPDLINLLTIIIQQKLSVTDLNQLILAFPSVSIGVISLLTTIMQSV